MLNKNFLISIYVLIALLIWIYSKKTKIKNHLYLIYSSKEIV
jgi:hypothetical protein